MQEPADLEPLADIALVSFRSSGGLILGLLSTFPLWAIWEHVLCVSF